MNRSHLFCGAALLVSVGAIASCSSGVGAKPTPADHPAGMNAVKDSACTSAQLRRIRRSTARTRIVPNPKRKGFLNTHKTAVDIKLGTLLVVSVRRADTLYLATPSGCWVKPQSHINHGLMTAVLLMNRTGYPALEYVPYYAYNAPEQAQDTYLHVVRR
jgi:hypothetical protein